MIAIIDYGAGNTRSVSNALVRLQAECIITKDHELISKADKVIIPGVGAAGPAMEEFKTYDLDILIPRLKQPVLGICLGLQIMCNYLEEGNIQGLGIFDTPVKLFKKERLVPHMGWNEIRVEESNSLIQQDHASDFYFVHSYYAKPCKDTIASCQYGEKFSAMLQKNNFYATQFHPEKSHDQGESILKNFIAL